MTEPLDALREWLSTRNPGPIPKSVRGTLLPLLEDAWADLEGCEEQGMHAGKLPRAEQVRWDPPVLSFVIERHGGTVCGSTRAERQGWTVDLKTCSTEWEMVGHRQVTPMAPRLDVRPIAEEIVTLVRRSKNDPRLHWRADGSVHVVITRIIPDGSGVRRTVADRRKRLTRALDERFKDAGWSRGRANNYTKKGD